MNRQFSPFASLTGAEKQIRWLEYQSIRLPYIDVPLEKSHSLKDNETSPKKPAQFSGEMSSSERPQPPPEIPRTFPSDFQRTKHSQYDAVIARLKQAELQTRYSQSQSSQQSK